MSAHYEKNLRALAAADARTAAWVDEARADPALSIVLSRSGEPVPRLGGRALHSAYHPEREGGAFAEGARPGGTVVVFGFGFGYHLDALARGGARVIAVEPSAATLKAAMETRDLSALIAAITIIPPDRLEETLEGTDYSRFTWRDLGPYPDLYRDERDRIAQIPLARAVAALRAYRIMVIGPAHGGSVTTARFAASALGSLGFEVDFVDNTVHHAEYQTIEGVTPNPAHRGALRTMFVNYLGERVAARADHWRPDLILALAQAPLTAPILERLKALGVPLAFWFVEDFRTLTYWPQVAPHYDYFFCIQKGEFIERLAALGSPFASYLPQAADPSVHRPLALTAAEREQYGAPVSFMGAGYPNRRKFFERLLDTPLALWGTEWDLATPLGQRVRNANRRLAPEEYVKIFNATQVNLNLHSSLTSEGVDPVGDFLNPRVFEIAACGAFQLVDRRRALGEMFEEGSEIAAFGDLDELRAKLSHYLDRPEERAALAAAGRRRVLAGHTFAHRMAKIINIVAGRDDARIEAARARRRGVNDVDGMIARTAKPETAEFLSQFAGRGNLRLDEVTGAIAKGSGPLSRPEALFVIIDQLLSQGPGRE